MKGPEAPARMVSHDMPAAVPGGMPTIPPHPVGHVPMVPALVVPASTVPAPMLHAPQVRVSMVLARAVRRSAAPGRADLPIAAPGIAAPDIAIRAMPARDRPAAPEPNTPRGPCPPRMPPHRRRANVTTRRLVPAMAGNSSARTGSGKASEPPLLGRNTMTRIGTVRMLRRALSGFTATMPSWRRWPTHRAGCAVCS